MKIRDELDRFKKYLDDGGVEILKTTSPFEWVRFKYGLHLGIIYQNKTGEKTYFSGENTQVIYDNFLKNKPSEFLNKVHRVRKSVVIRSLLERDGEECFYCGKEMDPDKETLEHLLPINKGGTNHIANLCLCCETCNRLANHMCIVDKVKLRDQLRRISCL